MLCKVAVLLSADRTGCLFRTGCRAARVVGHLLAAGIALRATGYAPREASPVLHDIHRLDAARLAQLHHAAADGRAGVVLEDDVAGLEIGEGSQHLVGSAGVTQQVAGDLGRQAVGDRQEGVLADDSSLRPRS